MKAEELRIGNYAYTTKDNETVIDAKDLQLIQEEVIQAVGIPLSEVWLLKFGFVHENNWIGYISNKARIGLRFNKGYLGELDIIQNNLFIAFPPNHIRHVHQLQNLYFALTGEELKINEI